MPEPQMTFERPSPRDRAFTKIVATIGPASEDCAGEMIDVGMSVARVNFSHGTTEDHERRIRKVREAARERMTPVGILADLPGPKMRTGDFADGGIECVEGELIRVRAGGGQAIAGEVLVDVPDLASAVKPGHRIALADGQVELLAEDVYGDTVLGRVRRAGFVGNHKGVHLPDSDVRYELPTAEDRELIKFARHIEADILGVSFVGHGHEIEEIRKLAPDQLIVSKIERSTALRNLPELIEASDGIMVARGDLGVELELEQVPIVQKGMLEDAVRAGKFTITATEMLESMTTSSRPTRAEVSDVANAVLDGTDAVMLSGETAVGEYPVEAVATMSRIAREVESSKRYRHRPRRKLDAHAATFSNATSMAAVHVANALELERIVCFTETGNTVRLISRFRPNAEIVALSPNPKTIGRLTALAHVRPILFRRETSLEEMLYMAAEMLVVRGLADYQDEIVFVAGVPPGVAQTTNVMKLHRIGEEVKLS
ncbi:MAG: pyruvate kinase [bacterium]|nr:pyruvate kinase [bacterium]